MIPYKFGDIILVPFPFTDQTSTKKRPAVVISSEKYNSSRADLIIMAITSQCCPVKKLQGRFYPHFRVRYHAESMVQKECFVKLKVEFS